MFTCQVCLQVKDVTAFVKNKSRPSGYSRRCRSCDREYYLANSEKMKATSRDRYAANPAAAEAYRVEYMKTRGDKKRLRDRKYGRANSPQRVARAKVWAKANKAYYNAKSIEYKLKKRMAMPKWLTKSQITDIQFMYVLAKKLFDDLGEIWHVDHIVPIRGRTVCGLHVAWNLQLLSPKDNNVKSNLHWPDKP